MERKIIVCSGCFGKLQKNNDSEDSPVSSCKTCMPGLHVPLVIDDDTKKTLYERIELLQERMQKKR